MQRQLKLFDAVCIMVGVIVGVGIFSLAPQVAGATRSAAGVILLWILGGLISLCGGLCYAELAAAFPHAGGDYVFLSRAYGRWAGFLFAWFQLLVIRPGDIAAMALVFAQYATGFAPHFFAPEYEPYWNRFFGVGAVLLLTAMHAIGVRFGKRVHNLLTVAKVLGIVLVLGLAVAAGATKAPAVAESAVQGPSLGLALIFVLFAYGGWNEMAYLAAELENPQRNVVRGLVTGLTLVMTIYVLLNLAFMYALGRSGLAASRFVAVDAVQSVLPSYASGLIPGLICLSALGAMSGLVFTGARISYALGADYKLFRLLGRWHPHRQTPLQALVVQALLASTIILVFGNLVETLVYSSAAVYVFYLATSLSTIVLRFREPDVPRPYRVAGYPWTVLVFAAVCVAALYSTFGFMLNVARYGRWQALMLLGLFVVGLGVYQVAGRRAHEAGEEPRV